MGVRPLDEGVQLRPRGEELDVQQVGAAALPHLPAEGSVCGGGRIGLASFGPGAQGDEQQLFPQCGAQTGQAAAEGGGVLPAGKPIGPELDAVGRQGGKGRPLRKDGGLVCFHNGQDDFGPPLPDAAAPDGDAGHDETLPFTL